MIPGLFITGTDTAVGKTRVAARIAAQLVVQGRRVGVYKPVASGCRLVDGQWVSDDALELWQAAGQPGELSQVCPQCFGAPLAPHLAAAAEGKSIDARLLRQGTWAWRDRCDVLLVEGAGGLMSPLGEEEYVADLAYDLGFPLVIVVRNTLGAINQALQTLVAAAAFQDGLDVAGLVLNHTERPGDDASLASNRAEIARRAGSPVLAQLDWQATEFDAPVDWFGLARPGKELAHEETPDAEA